MSESSLAEMQAKTQQRSFEFPQTDLELCLAKAEDVYASISQLLVHLKNPVPRNKLRRGLKELPDYQPIAVYRLTEQFDHLVA
jgi:hypothetical protein